MKLIFSVFGLLLACLLLGSVGCSGNAGTPGAAQATPTAAPLPTRVQEIIVITPPSPEEMEPEAPIGEKIAETQHFEFYVEGYALPVSIDEWREQAETVFDYVNDRLGTSVETRISVGFRQPPAEDCSARGLAMPLKQGPRIVIFADEGTSHAQLLGVLAHEVGHVFHSQGFEGGFSTDLALNEGLATWAAGDYFNAWHGSSSFDASVRSYLDDATMLPLFENYDLRGAFQGSTDSDVDCHERRDILYTEMASFIDFLIEQYGMQRFHDLLRTAGVSEIIGSETEIIKPPDYPGVYGSSLNQLEAAWLEHVSSEE